VIIISNLSKAHVRLENIPKFWRFRAKDFLNVERLKLRRLKSTFYAKNFVRKLSWCVYSNCAKKALKASYFTFQGRSRSSVPVRLKSSSAVLVISSKSVGPYLSATVYTLDEPVAVNNHFL